MVVATNNNQGLAQLVDSINDVRGFEVRGLSSIDVEYLDGVLKDAMKVDGKVVGLIC